MGKPVKGYKVFNPDWTCRGFKYAVGETFEEEVELSVCNRGFHFCEKRLIALITMPLILRIRSQKFLLWAIL